LATLIALVVLLLASWPLRVFSNEKTCVLDFVLAMEGVSRDPYLASEVSHEKKLCSEFEIVREQTPGGPQIASEFHLQQRWMLKQLVMM